MIFVQLSSSPGFVSWAIRFATFSKFSHVDFLLPDGRLLGSHVIGGRGVQVRPYSYLDFTRILILAVDAPLAALTEAFTQVGKPFDYTALFNFGFQRDWQEPDSWFCSEFVSWAFRQGGCDLFNPDADVWRITPRDITISPKCCKVYEGGPMAVQDLLQLTRTILPMRE